MSVVLDDITLQIKTESATASKGINSLTKSLQNLSAVLNSTNLDKISNGLGSINSSLSSINSSDITKVTQLADALQKLSKFGGINASAKKIKSATNDVSDFSKVNSALASGKVEESFNDVGFMLKDKFPKLQPTSANKELKQELSEVKEATDEVTESVEKSSKAHSNASSSVHKHYSVLQKLFGIAQKVSNTIKSKLSNAIKNLGKNTSKSTSAFGKLITSFGRIAFYRAIRTAIKEVTQAFKEGIQNISQYSKAINGLDTNNANQTMSQLATISLQLKNTLGSLAIPILNLVLPALQSLANVVMNVANAINQLLSLLGGKTTFTKAKEYAVDYAESLDKAGGSAKKLKDNLLGIDELNIINPDDNSGGGGASTPNFGEMFEEADIDPRLLDLLKWLKDMWHDADFFELGKMLGDKLAEMLANIPWEEIKRNCYKIGKSIATFINGFMRGEFEGQELSYLLGSSIAECINSAFEIAYGFVHNFDWSYFGHFIANIFNGLFETIDWNLIYNTFVEGAQGLADSINTFISDFHWDNISNTIINGINTIIDSAKTFITTVNLEGLGTQLGEQLQKTVDGIKWEDIGDVLGEGLNKAMGFAINFFKELEPKDLAQRLCTAINHFINTTNWELVGNTIGVGLSKALEFSIDFLNGLDKASMKQALLDFFKGLFESISWVDLAISIGEWLQQSVEDGIQFFTGGTKINETMGGLGVALEGWGRIQKVQDAIDQAGADIGENTSTSVKKGLDSKKSDFEQSGEYVAEGIAEGMRKTDGSKISEVCSFLFDSIKRSFWSVAMIGSPAKAMYPTGEFLALGILEGFKETTDLESGLAEKLDTILTTLYEDTLVPFFSEDKFTTLFEPIQTLIETKWEEFSAWWTDEALTPWWDESVVPWFAEEKWGVELNHIPNSFKTMWTQFSTWWKTTLESWWASDVVPRFAYDKWYSMLNNVKTAFDNQFRAITETIKRQIDEAVAYVRSACEEMASAVNEVLSAITDLANGDFKINVTGNFNGKQLTPHFASGGFPTQGQLFVARESGNEFVGSWGNQSAVANNEQIIAGISGGVQEAVAVALAPYLSEIANNTYITSQKDFEVSIDDRTIARANARGQKSMGRTLISTV